MEDAESE